MQRLIKKLALIVLTISGGVASATPLTLSDFSPDASVQTYEEIQRGFVATPLRLGAVTYRTHGNDFLAADNGFPYFQNLQAAGSSLITLYTNATHGLEIDFASPVDRVGLLLGSAGTLGWNIYALDNSARVINAISATQVHSGEGIFAGIGDARGISGIGLQVAGPNPNSWYTHFDDLRFEGNRAIPEPSGILLFGVALLALGFMARRTSARRRH